MAMPKLEMEHLNINGMTPFWSYPDVADESLEQAHAMLIVLAEAHRLSDTFGDVRHDNRGMLHENGLRNMNHAIVGSALAGVAKLVAVAMHCSEAHATAKRVQSA